MATVQQYESFLKRKIMEQQGARAAVKRGQLRVMPGNAKTLAGHQLAATFPFIERIRAKEPETAQRLMGYLKILPKYSALEMLLSEKAGIKARFEQEVMGILDAVLLEEMRADGTEQRNVITGG